MSHLQQHGREVVNAMRQHANARRGRVGSPPVVPARHTKPEVTAILPCLAWHGAAGHGTMEPTSWASPT
eukprot:11206363-Lingulodinium_polyedra.AAC.1